MKTVVANIRAKMQLDTDGDGKFDWQEFDEQTDPSKPNTPMHCPTYGCGATIAPARATSSPTSPLPYAAGALTALALILTRFTRRNRARSEE